LDCYVFTAFMAWVRFISVLIAAAGLLAGAEGPALGPHWTRVGGGALYLGFAGPIGAAVLDAAFSADGQTLYVRTSAERMWASGDLGASWEAFEPAAGAAGPFDAMPAAPRSLQPPAGEPQARVVVHPFLSGRAYALGRNLYRSPDEGRTWVNLTQDGPGSVIGYWQTSIAFHPADPDLVVVSNAVGLWKSADGGLSWSSLNERLPNFPVSRFVRGRLDEGLRIRSGRLGTFELVVGAGESWSRRGADEVPFWLSALPEEDRLRTSPVPLMLPEGLAASFRIWINGVAVSGDLTLCAAQACADPARHFISAVAAVGGDFSADPSGLSVAQYYVGTSDGLLWVSEDGGQSWRQSGLPPAGSGVWGIFADPAEPLAAVAVFGGSEGSRVFRTTNGGRLWDDVTADLPAGEIYAVAGSAQGGAVYLGGEFGVFYSADGLRSLAQDGFWRPAGGDLPAGAVRDLLLDNVAGFLYASVDDFGVFRARAPAVLDALRVLNAADLTQRPAAPGGLLTIFGAELNGVSVGSLKAPVLASGGKESQIQVPFEASGERLDLALETGQGLARLRYPLATVSPAIFVDRGGPLVLDAGSGRLLGAAVPARAGSQVLVLATGLGRVQPEWPTGLPAPLENPPATVRPVHAFLNGIPLKVVSATLAGGYIGTYIVQAEIPSALNFGVGELTLEVGGRFSNAVRIFTEP
jgi:uncharacterized protein (TIGR03437 family)